MDIIAGLAAAKQAVDIARALRDLDNALDQVALKGQIIDLMDKLNEVRGALQDAYDELRERENTIEQLRSSLAIRATTIERNGFRYPESKEAPGHPAGYPYCLRCDHVDNRLIPTVNNPKGRGTVCAQCNAIYTNGYRIPEPSQTQAR